MHADGGRQLRLQHRDMFEELNPEPCLLCLPCGSGVVFPMTLETRDLCDQFYTVMSQTSTCYFFQN